MSDVIYEDGSIKAGNMGVKIILKLLGWRITWKIKCLENFKYFSIQNRYSIQETTFLAYPCTCIDMEAIQIIFS